MTPLRTKNLELKLDNDIAFMSVTGTMSEDSLSEGLAWMDEVALAKDKFNLCVKIAVEDFDDLGAARAEFLRIGRLLRHAGSADKCAVLTNSQFLRNSAKVESAVIPGLEINAFELSEADTAESWLKGEPLIETAEPEPSAAPAKQVSQARVLKTNPAPKKSPWDNLDVSKVDI